MEVNEAVKNIKMFHFKNLPRFKPELIDLLKSLESENKKLKKENKALRKDKWELEGINEACRKENEAYREMWDEIRKSKKIKHSDLMRKTYHWMPKKELEDCIATLVDSDMITAEFLQTRGAKKKTKVYEVI